MSDLTNFVKENVGDSISKESNANTSTLTDGMFPSDAIKEERYINGLTSDSKPTVVSIVGFPGYGKTCFIATIYQTLLHNGEIGEFNFIDSDTFVGFERRIYMRRCAVLGEESTPQTKRTLRGDGHILTLRFNHPSTGERLIIVSDRSGEDYIDCANQKNKIKEHQLLKHSEFVLLFVDSSVIIDNAQIVEFSDTLSDLSDNVNDAQAFAESAKIVIVFNKIDVIKPELTAQFERSSSMIEALIREKFPHNNIVCKKVVSNNINECEEILQLFSEIVNFDTTKGVHNEKDYEGIDWVNNLKKQKKMADILIAGLIASGKSTLIGALAFAIKKGKSSYTFVDKPEDLTPLTKLYKPWLSQIPVNRTALGNSETFEFSLRNERGDQMTVSIPDYAGEDFERLLSKQSDILNQWGGDSNALVFLVKDFELDALEEAFATDDDNKPNSPIHTFSLDYTTSQVKNILLLKELLKRVQWKTVVIGIPAWDRYDDKYQPEAFLRDKAHVLYNYITHYLPETNIIGISAQGAEYSEECRQELSTRTMNNTRSWMVIDNERINDLTKIIDLIS